MHEPHEGDGNGRHAPGQERRVMAQFDSEAQARHAAQQVAGRATSVHVESAEETQLQQEIESAREGVSTVEVGAPAWVGLALGAILGAALGALIYAGQIVLPGVAPALSVGPVAAGFLGAGILGALGWFIGALLFMLRAPHPASAHQLRATVTQDALPEVEQILADAGALEVLVLGNGTAAPREPGDQGGADTHHGPHH